MKSQVFLVIVIATLLAPSNLLVNAEYKWDAEAGEWVLVEDVSTASQRHKWPQRKMYTTFSSPVFSYSFTWYRRSWYFHSKVLDSLMVWQGGKERQDSAELQLARP